MTVIEIALRAVPMATALVVAASASGSAAHVSRAKATINSCSDGSFVGSLTLVERPSSEAVKVVEVFLSARGLTPGRHAVHVHAVGNCTPCSAAGSHLDLGPFGHNTPVTENHPYHSGDLVNLNVGPGGTGTLFTTTSRIALSPDPAGRLPGRGLSLFDDDGASIVIHAQPDVYCPDPADANCAGGARAACGIIQREN